jgi:hypothetical protein
LRTVPGRTIGAFTPLPWSSTIGYRADLSARSFLLQVDLEQQYNIVNNRFAIYNHPNYGPTFGNNFDLYIPNGDINGCRTSFPSAYNYISKPYSFSSSVFSSFSGANSFGRFGLYDYEVYQCEY